MYGQYYYLVSFVAVFFGTWLYRKLAFKKNIIDLPNERSSHTLPTPRGGGVVIAIVFLAIVNVLYIQSILELHVYFAIIGSGLLITIIGLIDDFGHVNPVLRLLTHFACVIWVLFWFNGVNDIQIMTWIIRPEWLASLFMCIFLVWLLNLYNFMDGIDGIASIEAISVCLAAMIVYYALGMDEDSWILLVIFVATILGFLLWNFPRAKIFLGDSGSGFIGLILGVLILKANWIDTQLLWIWLILLGTFIIDATVTLLRRLLSGEKVLEAHKNHAYQYASRKYMSHAIVSISIGFINFFWLLPISLLVAFGYLDGFWGLWIAYIPLILLVYYFKAGDRKAQEAST